MEKILQIKNQEQMANVFGVFDENIKMIKECSEGNSEEDCKAMYERTVVYLNKKGFNL